MTTAELVRQLQAADPSGQLPVCIDGIDIRFVSREPGYFDGPYEQLIRDARNRSIVGGLLSTRGEKVVVHTCSIALALMDRPEMPVLVEVQDSRHTEMLGRVEAWRREAREG